MLYLFLMLVFSCFGQKAFMLGGWVHYGRAEKGIHVAKHHSYLFDQLSPFSYEVNKSGKVWDPFKRKHTYWDELHQHCKRHGILFVPTIWWTETKCMHEVLSDADKRENHIQQILDIVITNKFDGININYERVNNDDREYYLQFIEKLSQSLHRRGLLLYTTIGGRTGDNTIGLIYPHHKPSTSVPHTLKNLVHVSLNPGKGVDAVRYKKVLATCCDQIHIMGYDEWGRPYKHNPEHLKNKYYYSHSSNQWVEQIIKYHLTFIPAHKLVLGIPSYGLEFRIIRNDGTLNFKKTRNITYPVASEIAFSRKLKPVRTAGGELSFVYKTTFDERYVCYLDAHAVQDKIALVKKYRLKGMYIFTISGNEDERTWHVIEEELLSNKLKR